MTTPNPSAPLWPADFQGCRVNAQFLGLDGLPLTGTVTFTASPASLLDAESELIIVPKVFTATLDVNGSFSIVVPATDDPDINPNGWTYAVSENFSGGRKYNIYAPQNTTINLADVAPVPSSNGAAILRGPRGEAGGIQTVNGHSGDIITINYADVGADQAGAAAAAVTAALLKTNNLSDLPSPPTARTSLGLGGAATKAVGTTSGTVAAGDDTRIVMAMQGANNLSELVSKSTSRTNLGLGSIATHPTSDFVPFLASLPQGWLGESKNLNDSYDIDTLPTTTDNPVPGSAAPVYVTVTTPNIGTTRRIRIYCRAVVHMDSTASAGFGRYSLFPMYYPGTLLANTPITIGDGAGYTVIYTGDLSGQHHHADTIQCTSTVSLNANTTYTFCFQYMIEFGGLALFDLLLNMYLLVEDIGGS